MKLQLFQVNAFTNKIFGGNPACVAQLESWLPDDILLKIARENAVPETAFFTPNDDSFNLRWFSAEIELDLCGHATLATAHVLKKHLHYPLDKIVFNSKSGILETILFEDLYTLNFPSRDPLPSELPGIIRDSIDIQPKKVLKARDYVLVYETESEIKDIKINREIIDQINLDPGGVIITAKGDRSDFVSRFFVPQASIFEDPLQVQHTAH